MSLASSILVIGGVVWFLDPLSGKPNTQDEAVKLVSVTRGSIQTHVSETGTIQPSQTVEIKSQFSGEISRLSVTAGRQVAAGQLLAVIRQEPREARQAAQLRASIQEERISVEKARLELVRTQALFKKGFIAKKELEFAGQEHRRALVRLELAERQLLLALGGNQTLYQRYLTKRLSPNRPEEFQLKSPISGTILEVLVQPGEIITSGTATVGGGTVLMRVADLHHMVVVAKINEVGIARVKVGQRVNIRLDALLQEQFEGTVTHISTQGVKEENIVTYEVTITIDRPSPELRPMLTANIDIITESLNNVLTVPLESLKAEHGDDIVDIMENGQITERKVRVAFRTASQAVIAEGLEEGDEVVIPTFKRTERSRR
ncbi:MAG: efflux RND transporter periplasmic adaptor subunit [Nitrospira sp.]|nr:efflux RND transporter periplasmic adaptor subunit [Nitrospira sp.]